MIKQKRKLYFLLCFLLILGISITSYPHFGRVHYTQKVSATIKTFEEAKNQLKSQIDIDHSLDQSLYEEMVRYNQNLFDTRQKKLTNIAAYEELDFSLRAHGFENEMFGYITIPVMDVELPIYLGATTSNMNIGAVHLSQTSLPIGGENTNTVIAAHRGMATAYMFHDIEKLSLGDSIYMTNMFVTSEYAVTDLQIISPNDLKAILIKEGKDMITLITCHPFPLNYQRYLVYCEKVD